MRQIEIAFFDIDGTLHHGETLWEIIHKKNGTWDTLGISYWEAFLAGRIDYPTFARLDVKAWEGFRESEFKEALREVSLFTEAIQVFNTLRESGTLTYLISNGIAQLADHIVTLHGLTGYVANPVHIENGRLTGEITLSLPYHGKGVEVQRLLAEHDVK
ncbi:MAG: HAD-IB family phosphatase, partial [Candidatus Margulisiibacteriota bacterium]